MRERSGDTSLPNRDVRVATGRGVAKLELKIETADERR
jgi:hypothetical protein